MSAYRIGRHCVIGGGALIASALLYVAFDRESQEFRISVATAYVSLALLAITFALGPIYYLSTGRAPASTYLRRDISIWGGAIALVHVVFGLQVHLKGRMWAYFIFENWRDRSLPVRYDAFGAANYAGAAAAVIVIVLLAISNDYSIRKLGMPRWRGIQRSGRALVLFTVIHMVIYEVLEKRATPLVLAAWTIVAVVVVLYVVRASAQRAAR